MAGSGEDPHPGSLPLRPAPHGRALRDAPRRACMQGKTGDVDGALAESSGLLEDCVRVLVGEVPLRLLPEPRPAGSCLS